MLSSDIDKKILRIQESTRTSLPFFIPLHNILRMKFGWYYKWHLLRGTNIFHFLILSLFTAGMFFAVYNQSIPKSMATPPNDGFVQINTEAGWNAGTKTNLSVTAAPSIRISNASTSGIPLDASMLSANVSANTVSNILVNDGAYWNGAMNFSPDPYVQIDLGQEKQLSRFYEKYRTSFLEGYAGRHIIVSYSTNGTDFTQLLLLNSASSYFHVGQPLDYTAAEPITARYVRFAHSSPQGSPPPGMPADYVPEVDLIALYESSVATHISTATQLDNQNENASWTTFVSSASVPAYTTMKYRFRTSLDAETWSSWTASQNYVASIDIGTLLGNTDKKKRYLQVETTMANTDGSSTPTLASYTANFTAVCPTNTTEQDSSYAMNSKIKWDLGTSDNLLKEESGSIKIDQVTPQKNYMTITSGQLTASPSTGSGNIIDGDNCSAWRTVDEGSYFQIDLGQVVTNGYTSWLSSNNPGNSYGAFSNPPSISTNGTDWTAMPYFGQDNAPAGVCNGDTSDWRYVSGPSTFRYIRVTAFPVGDPPYYFNGPTNDFKVYTLDDATAIHTSATTQLDGTANINSWTTFVPDGTIPANTSIKFRFRTSADASAWGSWTALTTYGASIDIATLLGESDAAKRYLQVETTLANTNGVDTPTLNNYTANYVACAPATPDPTCSDGIQNQDETGVDCGGSCSACAVPPTCSDGIQNGSETGVDCGGSCGACTPDEPDPTCSDGIQNGDETGVDTGGSCTVTPPPLVCPADNIVQYCKDYAVASGDEGVCGSGAEDTCLKACMPGYTGMDQMTAIKVMTPDGGESYQLTKQMTLNWAYGNGNTDPPSGFPDLSKGEKTALYNEPIAVVLSTNGGTSYDKLLQVIYPTAMASLVNNADNAYVSHAAGSYSGVRPYTTYGTYSDANAQSAGYYSYSFTLPNAESLITDNARITLEPISFNCSVFKEDASDSNFKILAGPNQCLYECGIPGCQPCDPGNPVSISISASPDQAYLKPSQTQQYSATVINQEGVDITASCPVTWSMQTATAGSINTSGLLTATGATGVWSNAIKAEANCSGLSDFELLTFVTTNEVRRLEYAWANPWSANAKDPVKDVAFDIWGYDQFGLRITSADYSFSLLDNRIGSIPTNGRAINIATSNNYGCYPNKIKGTASYDGVEKYAFDSVSIFPADYALNSSSTGCSGEKISLVEKIFAAITGVKGASAATGQVFTRVSYGATRYHRPGQITQFTGVPRDQSGNYISGIPVQYILKNPSAGQLSSNGTFIATTTTGSYFGAVEVRVTQGSKVITKTFDVIVTTAARQAKSILAWGPSGASELTTNRILKMWKGSGYTFYSQLIDQFGDVIGSRATPEDISGRNLVNIEGYNTLTANNTEGTFSNALKITYDIDKINQSISREENKIDGASPAIYLTLDINDKNNDPKACIKAGEDVCDPLDPNCTTPCTGDDCNVCVGPDCVPPCIGPLCDVKEFFDDVISKAMGSATTSILSLAVAALLALGIALLNLAGNVAAALNGGNIFSFFVKGRNKNETRGTVYDAVSGLSIPYATVIVTDVKSKQSAFAISDKNGIFSIPVSPEQQYEVKVEKLNYELFKGYNSTKVKKFELKYNHNYFGGILTVPKDTYLFDYNIPVMQTETDSIARRVNVLHSIGKALTILNYAIIAVGLSFAFYAINLSPSLYNWIIFVLYIVLVIYLLIKYLFLSGHDYGQVLDAKGKPIELALVRAIRVKTGKLAKTIATDKNGKFGMALPVGVYHIYANKASMQQLNETDAIIGSAFKAARVKIKMDKYTNDTIKPDSQTEVITDQQKKAAGDMGSDNGKYVNNAEEIIQEYKGQ